MIMGFEMFLNADMSQPDLTPKTPPSQALYKIIKISHVLNINLTTIHI